jgi:hypothetical protein
MIRGSGVFGFGPAWSRIKKLEMTDEYKKALGIPDDHTLTEISSKREQRKGQDADIYIFEERNAAGEVVGTHQIRDTMSIYPPQTRRIIVE